MAGVNNMLNYKKRSLQVVIALLALFLILAAACSRDAEKNSTTVNAPQGSPTATATASPKSPGPVEERTPTAAATGTPEAQTPSGETENATATIAGPTGTVVPSQDTTPTNKTPAPTPTPTPKPTPTPTSKPTPTPNKYNGNQNFTEGKIIQFSHPSGFYTKPFTLELKYNTAYDVYYTLNGNVPTTSTRPYSTGITINDRSSDIGKSDKVVTVRAAAFRNGRQVGETVTATYIVNQNYNTFSARYQNLAVVSIITNKTNLYGPTGIITNYTEHGRASERPAHVEFFDANGTAGFSVDAGIRVYGGTSRANPQKSLKVVARKEYDPGNGKFKYPLIPGRTDLTGKTIDRYDSFILRAGGNDNLFSNIFGGTRNTLLRDALVHSLAGKISNIASQAYRPVVVYINGDYSGLYNLRDDLDNDFLEQHYNVPKEEVAILAYGHENGNWFYKMDEGTQQDEDDYKNMLYWISSNNMALPSNYERACKMLDMDNFIKYIAINVFANNRDWPHNNVRAWKYTGKTNNAYGQDGKWRYMLKDIDYSWGIYFSSNITEDVTAEEVNHSANVLLGYAGEISEMFASLMQNTQFRSQFLKFMDEIVNNYYSTATAKAMITKMKNAMAVEFSHIYTNRWYKHVDYPSWGEYKITLTYNQWLRAVDTLYEYAEKRPAAIKNLIRDIYG